MEIVLVKHTPAGSTLHPCEGELDQNVVVLHGVDVAPAAADELQVAGQSKRIVEVVQDPDGHFVCRCQ